MTKIKFVSTIKDMVITNKMLRANGGKAPKKYTDASDDKADKKAGIKEGSKKDIALDKKRGVAENDAKKPFPSIKPSHKGMLHKELGVAQGKKIPASKLNKALNSSNPKIKKQAVYAKNFGR